MSRYAFRVVTRPGDGLGFRLAGAAVEEIADADVAERFGALLRDPGIGVLAVQDEILARVPAGLRERAARDGVPVLLPFSVPRHWAEAGRGSDYVAVLIHRAIGYHVKIRSGAP